MSGRLPIQFWFLALIGLLAYPPAMYAYRCIAHSPSPRDLDQSAEEPVKRSAARLTVSIVCMLMLASLAVFIFTPAAAEFAQTRGFVPLLTTAIPAFSIYEIVQGFRKAEAAPILRAAFGPYSRSEQPRRYWASMIWNLIFGCIGVFLTFMVWAEGGQ